VVQGIAGVANLSDGIIVHAADRTEHDKRLRQTLQRLQDAGLTLNADKCLFRKNEIEFLGHKLSANGITLLTFLFDPTKSLEIYAAESGSCLVVYISFFF
jgi:hypothetical protein